MLAPKSNLKALLRKDQMTRKSTPPKSNGIRPVENFSLVLSKTALLPLSWHGSVGWGVRLHGCTLYLQQAVRERKGGAAFQLPCLVAINSHSADKCNGMMPRNRLPETSVAGYIGERGGSERSDK